MSDDFENQLRAGGEKVSEGVFRVDARRALAKLREYRLAEPHHWVLEVLRAASSAKATKVDVETDTDDIILRFDGKPFSPAVMKDLLAQALDSTGQGDRRSARYLSLGIAGALGLEPKWIKVSSGDVALEIRPPDDVTISAASGKEKGTFVHVRKKFGWAVVKAAIADTTPEELAIVQRAKKYAPRLTHNKKCLEGGELFKGGFVLSKTFDGEGMELEVGVPANGAGGIVVFDIDGVVVARRELPLPGRFICAWARCDRMRRNASGSDVVDSDVAVGAVLAKIRALALEVTAQMGQRLADGKLKDVWRTRYRELAYACWRDPKAHPGVRDLLEKFPLIPGPYGTWHTPAVFEAEVKAGRPAYYGLEEYPRGSHPSPLAMIETSLHADPIAKLLPTRGMTDASSIVRAKARASSAKHRWLSSPIEEPVLPDDLFLAHSPVSATSLTGAVGLVGGSNAGAFVRFLCQGRFVQQGDVGMLAPFRLRAVVNWQNDVPEKVWAEIPSDKVWSLVVKGIKNAAEKLILDGLGNLELQPHALDLVVRHANAGDTLDRLPDALRAARIFPLTTGELTSLDAMEKHKTWWFVAERTRALLLSGEPVLVLTPQLRQAVNLLAAKRLEPARGRLDQEVEIRARLEGPKRAPELQSCRLTVPIEGEGISGQAGIPTRAGSGLEVTLLRDGVVIETTSLTPSYGLTRAIVECKAFEPNANWDVVVRNPVFDRALSAIRMAEHKLAGALIGSAPGTLDAMPAGYAQFLAHFMRKHLKGERARNPEAERVESAALFATSTGNTSLAALRERAARDRQLWTLPAGVTAAVPADMCVVYLAAEQGALLADLLGVPAMDATAELTKAHQRARYLKKPVRKPELPGRAVLGGPVEEEGVRGFVGYVQQDEAGATIDLIVSDRLFATERFESNLPLAGALTVDDVDPSEAELPAARRAAVKVAILTAERDILRRAVTSGSEPPSQTVARFALRNRLDRNLPVDLAEALCDLPLFPCIDGIRSARILDRSKKLLFVTADVTGESLSRDPVVVASDPKVRKTLSRWAISEDLTLTLTRELDARKARQAIAPMKTIALGGSPLWRRQLNEPELEGEIGIVTEGAGRIQLLHERRPISVVEGALPAPFGAIFNSNALTLARFENGVLLDGVYLALLERLRVEGELLLDRVADALFAANQDEREKVAALLAPLTFWLVSRKKRSARLVKLPFFETCDGSGVSLLGILEEQKVHKSVLWSSEPGLPLSDARWVLRPRPGEADALRELKVNLKDTTPTILRAAEVRNRRKVIELKVDTGGLTERLVTDRVQGEVGLGAVPSKVLQVELYREHALLETFTSEHPVGALAKVNCDTLTPNRDWTKAARNKIFKDVITAVESAVERLVARRLDTIDGLWRPFADAAIRWEREPGGPLAEAIPKLAVFRALDGSPITVGAALAEHARSGRILTAEAGLPAPKDRVVLAKNETTLDLLRILGLLTEDTTGLLKRSVEIEAGLQARRLASFQFTGTPIMRLALASDGLRGELVIVGEGEPAVVVLAKDGIRVSTHAIGKLPIAGVVNVDGLEVNDDWTAAVVGRPLKAKLQEAAEVLFASLAAHPLAAADKPRARIAALAYLVQQGVSSAAHLDRMTGAALALAGAPLFLSEEGQWISLRAIADQVIRTGWISIFAASWRKRDTRDELVLQADGLRDGWISALETVLGPSCVERVADVELWRKQLAERDPAPGTPEIEGLKRLRKEMRLLRAGALGHVTPDDLQDVRVRSDRAKAAITYDPKRKLVFLDGTDPDIARALEEIPRRPERIYILLAAIYGAVNRALERITDADEAEMLGALAVHLAANPRCLGAADAD